MTLNINDLNADLIYRYLDNSEGGNKVGDGKVEASIWNKFIDETGIGNKDKSKIRYSINRDRTDHSYGALVSLNSYLKKADENTKQKVVDFLKKLDVNEKQTEIKGKNTTSQIVLPPPQSKRQVVPETTVQQQIDVQEKTKKEPVQEKKQTQQVNPQSELTLNNSDFSDKTSRLLEKHFEHSTHLLDVASDSLGIKEVSYAEFQKMTPEERQNTQYDMIGNYGHITDQWCAHTVSTLSERAGMNIGRHKATVQEFINWATNRHTYFAISTIPMNSSNLYSERNNRASQIREQMNNMQEGDFIIMKNQYVARTSNAGDIQQKASHIMIIENIDIENGIITVIEGNANENKYENEERVLVKNSSEGKNGAQIVGEFQEINKRDGLIRKQYTPEELAAIGYSGYIDNSSIMV